MVGGATRKVKKQYAVIDGVARKIKKSYQVVGGVARLFYSSDLEVSYTGTYTTSDVTVDGMAYTLWTITGSGTLTVSDSVRYWMCGGGGRGGSSEYYLSTGYEGVYTEYAGGGGGGGYVSTGTITGGKHVVTVGARAGASKISNITASAGSGGSGGKGGNGGSGGGAAGGYNIDIPGNSGGPYVKGTPGTGKGVSTYPFGLTSLKAHCAGGGGGGYYGNLSSTRAGGAGGTNGGAGGATGNTGTYVSDGGSGGTYGGGNGANATTATAGGAASFYGGGGGGASKKNLEDGTTANGGYGYQGVIYLLIPKAAA